MNENLFTLKNKFKKCKIIMDYQNETFFLKQKSTLQ